MKPALPSGNGLRDSFLLLFCCVCLPFEIYFLYLNMQYNNYLADFRTTQRQETQLVNKKITKTISMLRAFTELVGDRIRSSPENYQSIQARLTLGQSFSQDQRISVPMVQTITYYKLTEPKAVITPSMVASLYSVPHAFDKPVKDLESMTTKNNEMVGTIPVLDQNKRLKGVLEIKVPSVDIQKFVGADKLITLKFPQMFDQIGKQVIQEKPLDFSLSPPLSYTAYLFSHKASFWLLAYAAFIGSMLLFLYRKIVRKQLGFAYGTQIGQLKEELDALTSSRSSLEARNFFQDHLIQRLKGGSQIVYKMIERFGRSYDGDSLSRQKKQVLIKEAETLAETLSQGMANYERKSIAVLEFLDHIKLQVADKLRELNITWNITCPKDLTFIGDELFTKQILLNVVGYPLYHMPKNEEVFISASQENGFVYVEVRDHRFVLTNSAKSYLDLPEDFIEDGILRQICAKHNVGYESCETKEGAFYTKVSFPLNPVHVHAIHTLPSPSELLH